MAIVKSNYQDILNHHFNENWDFGLDPDIENFINSPNQFKRKIGYFQLALYELKHRRTEEAIDFLEQSAMENSRRRTDWTNLKKFASMIDIDSCLKIACVNHALSPLLRGIFWMNQNKIVRAEACFKSVPQDSPEHYNALIGLISIYHLQGLKKDTQRLFSRLRSEYNTF